MDLTSTSLPTPARHAPANPLDVQALVGPAAWQRLAPAVQHRFDADHEEACYQGALSVRCSIVGRLFALASNMLGGPLTGFCRNDIPARVHVYDDGNGGVVWERHLAMTTGEKIVRSTKKTDHEGRLVERTDGGLSMRLDVFESQGVLVFRSRGYFLDVMGLRMPVPMLLTPGVCRVEHHDLGQGQFRFTLSMIHPVWGTTFEQTGVFNDPKGQYA